jgi:RNA recognition motif-containing protein
MGKKLYVGNLHDEITEAELREFFTEYGTVTSVMIKYDKVTGEPWGYGFVEMESEEQAQAALQQANGQIMVEQPIKIDILTTHAPAKGPA